MGKQNKRDIIKKSQMVSITNSVTGEMDTAKVSVIVQRDTPKFRKEPFTLMFQAVNEAISRNITPATAKVLLYVCANVGYGNLIEKGTPQMAKELGYSTRQILRAMKELKDMGVILSSQNPSDGRYSVYHLNPMQSWKGKVADRAKKAPLINPSQIDIFDATGEEPPEGYYKKTNTRGKLPIGQGGKRLTKKEMENITDEQVLKSYGINPKK